jgi:hypothetical protein
MRTVGAIFQAREIMRVIAAPPAIKGLPADPEMAAGEGRIATIAEIMTHPDQPELGATAQLAPKARELSRFGYPSPMNLHGDTLSSVTNHSEREQTFGFERRAGDPVWTKRQDSKASTSWRSARKAFIFSAEENPSRLSEARFRAILRLVQTGPGVLKKNLEAFFVRPVRSQRFDFSPGY